MNKTQEALKMPQYLRAGSSRQAVYVRVVCGCRVLKTTSGTSITCHRCSGKGYIYDWI